MMAKMLDEPRMNAAVLQRMAIRGATEIFNARGD